MENLAALVTAVAALVTALIGAVQIVLLRRQMKEDARPYIVVDVVPGLHGAGSWDFVLQSTGRSTAHCVTVTTDPALGSEELHSEDHITDPLVKYLGQARSLPPGARHRVMWRYEHEGEESAGAPAKISVRTTYRDDHRKRYTGTFEFDIDALAKVAPVPNDGPRKSGSENGKELQNIDRAIRNLARHVGELRR